MPATWTQLRGNLAGMLGDPDNIAYPESVLTAALLSASRGISQELNLCKENCVLATVTDQEDYLLDSTAAGGTFNGLPYRIRRAMIQISTYTWNELRPDSTRIIGSVVSAGLPNSFSFNPNHATLAGPTLSLFPTPNAVYNVRLLADTIPGDTTANPAGPSLPPEAEDLLLVRAVRRLLVSTGSRALDQDLQSEEEEERRVARSGGERAVR